MGGFKDISGQKFGKLTALYRLHNYHKKGYEPSNCRWITMKQQNRNRRSNRNYKVNGVTRCLSEWCEIYSLKYKLVWKRLKLGWSIEQALELEDKQCQTALDKAINGSVNGKR